MAAKPINRRRFLQSGLAASATVLVAKGTTAAPARSAVARAPAVQGTTNLRMMVWGRPDTANWNYEAFRRVKPDAAQRITVEPIVGGEGDPDVAEQFRLMLSAGGQDVPDIIRFNRSTVAEFATAGVLADLTEMIEPFAADMIDSARQLASFDERVVAIPAQLKSKVWFYRRDLFEQAGVDPNAVADIDAFVAAGRQLHEAVPESYIFNLRADPPGYLLQNVLSSFAPISFYDREAEQFQVTTHPGFRGLFETLAKLRDPAVAAPIDDFTPDWATGFADGAIASSLINEWMTGFLPEYVPDQGGMWGVHAWPAVGISNQGSDAGGAVWVIPDQAKNKEAAFEFLSTVHLTPEGSLAVLEIGGLTPYVTSAREMVPTMPQPAANPDNPLPWPPEFFGEDYFPVVFDAQERLAWIDFTPATAKELDLLQGWVQRFVAGQADIDAALEGLQSDLEGQIGDPWQV